MFKHDLTVFQAGVLKAMIIMIFQPCVDSQSCIVNVCAFPGAIYFCLQTSG